MIVAAGIYDRYEFIDKQNTAGFPVKTEMKEIFMYAQTLVEREVEDCSAVYDMREIKGDFPQ